MHTTKGCHMAQNLDFFFRVSLIFRHIQRKKESLKTFVFLVPISCFWQELGQQPDWPEYIPCYLCLEMQQTQAGPVLGVDTSGAHRAHTPEQTLDCGHQMRAKALGSIIVVELLERS